jgi:hypothetical protein
MSVQWIVSIAVGYLVFVAFLFFIVQRRTRGQRVDLIAKSVGLPLTDDIAPVVRSTQRAGVWTGFLSIAGGIIAATVYILVGHVESILQVFWIDFTGVIAGAGIGSAIATFAREGSRQKGTVRIARLGAVSLSDYRSPFDQWAPRLVVALALLGIVLRAAIYPHGFSSVPFFLYVYAGVMVASLAVYEASSRLLIRSGQPATSELDLAWDDALTSRALASISAAPLYLGGYFGLAAWAFYPATHTGATAVGSQVQIDVQFVALVLVLATIGAGVGAKAQRRYLRKLWPDLATRVELTHS